MFVWQGGWTHDIWRCLSPSCVETLVTQKEELRNVRLFAAESPSAQIACWLVRFGIWSSRIVTSSSPIYVSLSGIPKTNNALIFRLFATCCGHLLSMEGC